MRSNALTSACIQRASGAFSMAIEWDATHNDIVTVGGIHNFQHCQ